VGSVYTIHLTINGILALAYRERYAPLIASMAPARPAIIPPRGKSILVWIVCRTNEFARLLYDEYYTQFLPAQSVLPWKPGFKSQSIPDYIDIHRPGDTAFKLPKWARIQFKTVEQGREKFQSAAINFAHVDEEIPRDVYRELYMRTGDRRAPILFTFTYLKGLTWAYDELYVPIVKGQKKDWAYFCFDLEKNEALSKEFREEFIRDIPEHLRPSRVHGKIELAPTNLTYFPASSVNALSLQARDPSDRFAITVTHDGQYLCQNADNGPLHVWKNPRPDHHYLIGADPSGGRAEDGDPACAAIFDPDEGPFGEFVAFFLLRCYPEEFGNYLAAIGALYNNAVIAVEANTHGSTTLRTLENKHYRRLLRQFKRGQNNFDENQPPGINNAPGTRADIIACLNQYLRTLAPVIPWALAIRELASFIWNTRKDRPEAAKGAHDDIVFAMAYALLADQRFNNNASLAIITPDQNNALPRDTSEVSRLIQLAVDQAQKQSDDINSSW